MTDWSPPRTLPGRVSRVPNLPGLDGLRAIAVVAVMIYHADSSWLHGGFLGVEVFFVISGYLITLLLIAEFEGSGRVSLRQFWLRRFRRLLPALFVMLGLLMIYLVVGFPSAQGRTRGDIVGGVAYVSNWYQIAVGAGYTAREAFAPLRHLWSLAVEEQFYLVWPLIMLLILSRAGLARLPRVALWLVGISIFITAVVGVLFVPGDIDSTCTPDSSYGYWHFGSRCISVNDALYLGTVSRAGGLMLGAAFAMVWRPLALLRGPMRKKGHWLDAISVLGLAGLAVLAWNVHLAQPAETILTGSRFDPWLFRGGFLLTGVATLLVIAAVTHRRAWMGKLLGNPLFRWVGTRSYGLYLYHWPIYQIIRKEAGIALRPSQFVLAMAITIPFTEMSYRYVELPIRQGRVGEWLRGERRRPTPAVVKRRRRIAAFGLAFTIMLGFASVSIAIAPNKCVGQVECANAEGAAAIEAAASSVPSAPFVPPPSPSVPSAPSAAPTADSAEPSTPGAPSAPDATAPEATTPTAPSAADPAAAPGETAAPAETAPAIPQAEAPTGDAAGAATAPSVAPETTAEPTTAEPTTTLPVAERPPYAIGESVMLGAAAQLQAGGFVVNADTSRQGKQMVDVIGQHRAAGELGNVVVIQSGTNGSVSQDTYDRMMALLPPEMTPIVVFLTVHADRGWIASNNALIRALPSRYPNVRVLEWDGLVAGGAIPGMARDGIHLDTSAAKQTYANYIFDLIGRRDLVKPVG